MKSTLILAAGLASLIGLCTPTLYAAASLPSSIPSDQLFLSYRAKSDQDYFLPLTPEKGLSGLSLAQAFPPLTDLSQTLLLTNNDDLQSLFKPEDVELRLFLDNDRPVPRVEDSLLSRIGIAGLRFLYHY